MTCSTWFIVHVSPIKFILDEKGVRPYVVHLGCSCSFRMYDLVKFVFGSNGYKIDIIECLSIRYGSLLDNFPITDYVTQNLKTTLMQIQNEKMLEVHITFC